MKLSQIKIPTRTVVLTDGHKVELRGLSFSDISALYDANKEDLDIAVDEYIKDGQKDSPETVKDPRAIITHLVGKCPDVFAKAIAIANDDPGAEDNILKLGIVDQIDMAVAVSALTFKTEDDIARVVGVLLKGMSAFSTGLEAMTGIDSRIITGDTEKESVSSSVKDKRGRGNTPPVKSTSK